MYYIDSHAHLCKEYYGETLDTVVTRAIQAGVTKIILPCVNAQGIRDILDSATLYPQNLFPLIGLHPTDVADNYIDDLKEMERHLSSKGIVGIGEIGLDLYHTTATKEIQEIAFRQQLSWASDLQMPLSIHIRNAYAEAIEILRDFSRCHLRGILHCFSGGIQEAEWAVRYGLLLGIGGVVTFKNNKLQEIVKRVGLENIALETDSPFLAPTPYRGQRNESAYIPLIAQKVADILETTPEEVAEVTTRNVERIFNI